MAKLFFGMNQSLDGYVDHMAFGPSPTLFRHFIEQARDQAGSVYGRRLYDIMRYWDEDHPEWDAARRDFAAAWRRQPKWVVSRSLKSVGPNATLIGEDDLETVIRGLKDRLVGDIQIGGPDLARTLIDLGLIDEYRLYLHPIMLGRGTPFFAGSRQLLRFVASDRLDEDVIRVDIRSRLILSPLRMRAGWKPIELQVLYYLNYVKAVWSRKWMIGETGNVAPFDAGYQLEPTGGDGVNATFRSSFGGLTMAGATMVAARSCPDKALHSAHTWFLRPVPTGVPIDMRIERVRDGRMLSHRRIRLLNEDKLLCEMTFSFSSQTTGVTFQSVPLEAVPRPEDLPTEMETAAAEGWERWHNDLIEWRFIGRPRRYGPTLSTSWDAWARPREPLVDAPAEHMAAVAYLSDNKSDWSAATRIDNFTRRNFASLDNALWVHRALPWDDWWLVRSTCDVALDGCAFSRRMIYARDGSLIATVAQEAFYAD